MTRRCETCRFWGFLRETEPHVEIGECRRHAPVPGRQADRRVPQEPLAVRAHLNAAAYANRGDWPMTMFDDWCGEHMPKIKGGEAS